MKILEKVRNHVMGLVLLGALSSSAVGATETLNIFQITQGYNSGPGAAPGRLHRDNWEYFGFAFHDGKMAACWMDNSQTITSTPPAPVPNQVFASVRVNSPWDVVVGPNVVVSKNPLFNQPEPELALDPLNTNHITIIAPNFNATTALSNGLMIASSSDGGKKWTTNFSLQKNNQQPDSKIPIPLSIRNGDVRARYDSKGNLFIVYQPSFAPDGPHLGTTQFPFLGYLSVSTDHGKSFKSVYKFDPQPLILSDIVGFGFDFSELAVGQDQVGVTANFDGVNTTQAYIFIFPIEGQGKIGSPTRIVNPNGTVYGDGYGSMAFSPAGGLLIAQTDYAINSTQSCGLIFTSFLPRGAKEFPAATTFQPFNNVNVGGFARYPSQPSRATWTQPKVAYVYNGHHYGRVYMVYLDNPNIMAGSCSNFNSNTNVFIVYSDDDGKSWSAPYAIPKTSTNTRIMPHIAIDQTTGNIGVAWLDAVNDPANVKVQVFATVIPWNFFD